MLENILTLLVDEVRELKKSNQDLHKEVVLLREKQQQTDQKVDRFANAVPRHHPMVMDISHPVLTSSFHKELYRMMPFLAHYHMKGSSFVIDDIRKPFVAMQVPDMATMRSWTTLPCGLGMPMIISANRVFCSVIQIPLHQLIGSPFSSVCRNETNRRLICRFAKNRGAAVSEVIDAVCTNRTPSGKMRNLKTRLQIFYGPDGQMKWIVSCFDAMVEQSGEHETKSITFPSPLLSCLTEGGTADDQPPPQHQQHEDGGLAGDSMDEGNGMALTEDAGRSGFFLSSSSSSSSSNSSSPSSSLSPLSFSSSSFFSLPSSPSSSLLPAGSTPPPIFASLVSSQPWHSPIPEGFFHEGPNCRFQQMDDEDSQDRVQEDCSSRPQDDEQPQQQQQQQPSQPDGYLQDMLFQLPSPSLLNPSPSPAMPFVVSPLSAQDDFSWLLSSPKPSPPPIRYQD